MLNYSRYNELKAQIKALEKEFDALKAAIIEELERGESVVIDDKIIYSDGIGKVTVSQTEYLKPEATAAAWDLARTNPEKYINFKTRETLTVKAC